MGGTAVVQLFAIQALHVMRDMFELLEIRGGEDARMQLHDMTSARPRLSWLTFYPS